MPATCSQEAAHPRYEHRPSDLQLLLISPAELEPRLQHRGTPRGPPPQGWGPCEGLLLRLGQAYSFALAPIRLVDSSV